jgi:hypothetical protein
MLPYYSSFTVSYSLNKVFLTFFVTKMFGNMEKNLNTHTHTHTHTHELAHTHMPCARGI